jgi:hypothetical protein
MNKTYESGTVLKVLENGNEVGRVVVVSGSRDELRARDTMNPSYESLFVEKNDAWKLTFPGLGDEICTNPTGPTYQFEEL